MEQSQTCPSVSRLLDPMRCIPKCKSTELCVCPYAINDLGKMNFLSSSQGMHYLENALFPLGEKTKQLSDFWATRFPNAWAVLCLLLQQYFSFNDGSEPSPSTTGDLPVGSGSAYRAPMMLGHYWGPWDMSHSQISEAELLGVFWEWGLSTTL